MTTQCPHCGGHVKLTAITPRPVYVPKPDPHRWKRELLYMVGKGWLFSGTLVDEKWKADPDLSDWLHRGWVEHDHDRGFRITPLGEQAANSKEPAQ